jgi:CBS domain-containing protein
MFTSRKTNVHALDTAVVTQFLKKTLPFNELDNETLENLARHATIDFFPKGTNILTQDVSEVKHIYLIQKGGVKLYLQDESGQTTLKDYRGEGSVFGALAIIRNARSSLTVEAIEDTFCFLFTKKSFLELLNTHPGFSQYYLKTFSENYIKKSFSELRKEKLTPKTEGALYLFTVKVNDILRKKPEVVTPFETVQSAAQRMSDMGIGSLLIKNEYGKISGIITDKDLRSKVVAKGLPYMTPVEKIMNSPVETIPANKVCFDALLSMMSKQIHHLAVEDEGRVIGVITSHDILVLQGESPVYLFKEIMNQHSIERLYELSMRVPLVVRPLIEEGAKANNITRMITVLNDLILDRILTLMQEELGPPPVPFCWLVMGSEGRKEQTFRTDQDNALIYSDPKDEQEREAARRYFKMFGQEAINHLVKCGYPICQGGNMASNPKWNQPLSVWKGYFERWVSVPEPEEVLNSTIYFDFRPAYGHVELGFKLREHLNQLVKGKDMFLRYLAQDCFRTKPPLSFFKNFIVDRDGEHKNRLDIKVRGLVPFWDFARVMSLRHGIDETNTLGRLELLKQGGHMPEDLYNKARESYEFQMQLRFLNQLKLMEAGETPHNFIDPAQLSDLEKQTLKGAFSVITSLQGFLKETFKLNIG